MIGKRGFGAVCVELPKALSRTTPACSSFRRGMVATWAGSGKPFMICACRIPDKYVFRVAGASPCIAISAQNLHSSSSFTGNG